MSKTLYQTIIIDAFNAKVAVNPRYSLRAFALYLNIDSSSLSSIMKGKRSLPGARARDFADRLQLKDKAANEFIKSVEANQIIFKKVSQPLGDIKALDIENDIHMRLYLHWESYAIYALLATVDEFKDITWISSRLDIEEDIVLEVLGDLLAEKLIEKNESGYRKCSSWLTMNKVEDIALTLAAHRDSIQLYLNRENDLNYENSSTTSITFSADPDRMEGAFKIIHEFKRQLSNHMRQGNNTEVYQCNIQFFPLTKKR